MANDGRVALLVDHGEGFTVGDDAMLVNVLHDLRRALEGRVRFYVTCPDEEFGRYLDRFADVERVPSPNACCELSWQPLWVLFDKGRRWEIRDRVERAVRPLTARRLARRLAGEASHGANKRSAALAHALARSNAVHIVGGGSLNDPWGHTMIWPKWALARAARALGKRVFLTGQGIGPLRKRRNCRAVRELVAAAEFCTLRERLNSPDILARIGCPAGSYRFEGDDALGLPAADEPQMAEFWRRAGVTPPDAYVCVNIRFAGYAEGYETRVAKLAHALDRVAEVTGLPLIFLPMSAGLADDAASAQNVAAGMERAEQCRVITVLPTPGQAKAVAAGARACIGLSYHFALLALSEGIPAVMIYRGAYYTGKMQGLADCFGVPELAISMEELDGEHAANLLERAATAPEGWRERLLEAGTRMRETIERSRREEADRILNSVNARE